MHQDRTNAEALTGQDRLNHQRYRFAGGLTGV
jgi:hypothetical protein